MVFAGARIAGDMPYEVFISLPTVEMSVAASIDTYAHVYIYIYIWCVYSIVAVDWKTAIGHGRQRLSPTACQSLVKVSEVFLK